MTSAGSPHTSDRNRTFRRLMQLNRVDSAISARIGTTPLSRGMPKSCMGTDARSEISSVSTSSIGSSSPICRLPLRRSPTISSRYRITVRRKAVAKLIHALSWFFQYAPMRPEYAARGDRYLIFQEENQICVGS